MYLFLLFLGMEVLFFEGLYLLVCDFKCKVWEVFLFFIIKVFFIFFKRWMSFKILYFERYNGCLKCFWYFVDIFIMVMEFLFWFNNCISCFFSFVRLLGCIYDLLGLVGCCCLIMLVFNLILILILMFWVGNWFINLFGLLVWIWFGRGVVVVWFIEMGVVCGCFLGSL